MAQTQDFSFYSGERIALDFVEADYTVTPAVPTNVTGWTIKLTIENGANPIVMLATLTVPVSGQFTFTLTSAQTAALDPSQWPGVEDYATQGRFNYSVKRIDSGFEATLTVGTITVLPIIGGYAAPPTP
jgi:hypothetical protein